MAFDIELAMTDTVAAPAGGRSAAPLRGDDLPDLAQRKLEEAFQQPFAVLDLGAGRLNRSVSGVLRIDLDSRLALCEEVCRRGEATIIEDCAPLALLVVPLPSASDPTHPRMAVSTFVTQTITSVDDIVAAATTLGVTPQQAFQWSRMQRVWPPLAIEQLSRAVVGHTTQEHQNQTLRKQLASVSQHLLQTFEELNLLHRLNEHLSLAGDEQHLAQLALQWLSEVLPAECLVARFERPPTDNSSSSESSRSQYTVVGNSPLETWQFPQFIERLGPDALETSVVVDSQITKSPTWYYPGIKDVLSVPVRSSEGVIGWLLALNLKHARLRRGQTEFGSLEMSLLSSVAAILGMHSGNVRLYREQAEFFESVVRALSSAIDAKDQYTRGHSERVARVAVCLARKLGCSREEINAIYLSGLLHDIGKIGVDDNILRKDGPLTAEEFEQIQQHPQFGYQILKGVRQLEQVLPAVLHHHESWDGTGYPHALAGQQIPFLARIVAVADAFDAMTSDRTYRKGMPMEKLEQIFNKGAGQQWDPEIIDAFFAVKGEILQVVAEARELESLDVGAWTP